MNQSPQDPKGKPSAQSILDTTLQLRRLQILEELFPLVGAVITQYMEENDIQDIAIQFALAAETRQGEDPQVSLEPDEFTNWIHPNLPLQ